MFPARNIARISCKITSAETGISLRRFSFCRNGNSKIPAFAEYGRTDFYNPGE
jgi:hypothetical protein